MLEIHHPNVEIRSLALRDLQIMDPDHSLPLLEARLERESHVGLRFELVRSINEFKALQSKERRQRRVLGPAEGGGLRKALIGMDKDMQQRACQYCARHQRVEFLPLILKVEASHPSAFIRMCSAHMIRYVPERYFQRMKAYLDDSDAGVRATAADTLAYLAGTQSIAMLVRPAIQGNEAAFEALQNMDPRRVSAALRQWISLGADSEAPSLVDTLISLLSLEDPRNQDLLSLPLPQLQQASSLPSAIEWLKGQSLQSQALGVLLLLNRPESNQEKQEQLQQFLSVEDRRVQANTLEALSMVWPEEQLDWFLSWLNHSSNRICGNAIVAISRSPHFHEQWVGLVKERLQALIQGSSTEALTALYCIGCMQNEAYLSLLEDCLQHFDSKIADRAMQILANWSLVSTQAALSFSHRLRHEKISLSQPVPNICGSGSGLKSSFRCSESHMLGSRNPFSVY